MKKQLFFALCASLLTFANTGFCAEENKNPVDQLTATITEAVFSPNSSLRLSPDDIAFFANALLLRYLESHYALRMHLSPLTEELQHRKEVIEKTCTVCLDHIQTHGSAQLKALLELLEHNMQSLKRTYLNKYQEELIKGERDTFMHAQALQQVTTNLIGLWYKTLLEGMQKNNIEAKYCKIAFNQDGLIPEEYRMRDLPAANTLM